MCHQHALTLNSLFFQTNPIAQSNQAKQTNSKTISPKKTYPNPISESGYKINPIILETQREMETENEQKRRGESFIVDTNPLGLNYRGVEKRNEPSMRTREYRSEAEKFFENRNGQERSPRKQNETRKTSKSSNVLVVRQPSNAGYARRKQGRDETAQNVELHEVQDVSDLRARLRRTGQIEEGSGLHKIELARQHSQRIIDVQ